MRRLTLEGVAPGEAARVALGPAVGRAQRLGRRAAARPRGTHARAARRVYGGRVLALPGADAAVRGLGRAAMALDAHAVTALVRDEVAAAQACCTRGTSVLRPVLVAVGARWAATGEGVEVEHLLSDCTAVVLREIASAAPRTARPPAGTAVVRARRAPLAAAARARRRPRRAGRRCADARSGTSRRGARVGRAPHRPRGAVRLVLLPGTADPAVLEALPVTRPATAVVVGGPGWAPDRLPRRVTVAADLTHALELVDRALGA